MHTFSPKLPHVGGFHFSIRKREMGRRRVQIDFIIRSNSEYGQLEFSRRRRLSMGEIEFWVVSPEDLIIAKLRWIQDYQSDRQINDIKSLLLNPSIYWDYLTHWIQKLKLNTFNIFDNA